MSAKLAPIAGALILFASLGPAVAANGPAPLPSGFLSEPTEGPAIDVAMGFLQNHQQDLGLTSGDFDDHLVSNQYVSRHNGVTHIYLQQRLDGVQVHNGILNINVMPDGRILNLGNRWVGDLAGKVANRSAALSPELAVDKAAVHLGLHRKTPLTMIDNLGGSSQDVVFTDGGISLDEIPVGLVYQKMDDGSVRLAWNVRLRLDNQENWWNVRIDASTGEALAKNDWIAKDSYRVVEIPGADPDGSPPAIVTDPADATASPFGWHDTNGVAGAEFTDTRGNNVNAQDDLDANNTGGSRPDGGATLDFDFPIDLSMAPINYLDAAIVNLFYWNNIIHDVMYQYGFDEPAGNFQENNYGNGGLGSDPVEADAQDGSATNNATFGTPSDGANPRMSMFIWTFPFPNFLTVNSPGSIAGDYQASAAAFGPAATVGGTTADLEEVNDGAATTSDGCEALIGFTSGRIALIDRGGCPFVQKVNNAQNAGAIAAIIVNNAAGPPITLGGTDPGVTIPSGMVSMADGATIRAELPGVNTTFRNQGAATPVDRDSDMDTTVVAHEYGHGISNRLTGGPAASGCLGTQEQMGEGWSDFYGLVFTAQAADTADQARGIAPYLRYQPPTGAGIRRFPYSRDTAINPDTFSSLGITGLAVPHGVGSVWTAMTWDLYWNLVDDHGFNPDIYGDWTTGGNNRAIQLVTDGLKLQPCSPGFVDGRDAILAADLALTGGADRCAIWRAFGARGMGMTASSGSVNVLGDETENFDIPSDCLRVSLFEDGFESGNTSVWDATVTPP